MKKIVFVIITVFTTITSCSSNEDKNFDPIIGTWKISSITVDGKNISIGDECQQKSTLKYLENGTVIDTFYFDNGSGNCKKTVSESTWENIGNSVYNMDGIEIKIDFFNNKHTVKVKYINFDNKESVISSTYSKI